MVEESVEHAFDDLRTRQWIEMKLRADQTLQATDKALQEAAHELDPEERAQIGHAVERVHAALATADPHTQTGDLQRLKTALGQLDETTRPLADLLMERAVEAMLRKRGVVT
jgi:molecular chaperone DnaK (HSP70)